MDFAQINISNPITFQFQVKRLADMILEQKLKKESDEKAENKAIEERKQSEQRSKVMDGTCHFYAPVILF